VLTYPEPGTGPTFTGKAETGSINCNTSPCTLTISVKVADVGGPTTASLFESVGAYSLVAAIQEGAEDNASAQSDTVPLEIDGVCCYNFRRK
jgi:hypothetical protein